MPLQPEKKNPGLTPMDWVKFLGSAIVGLVSYVFEVLVVGSFLFCLSGSNALSIPLFAGCCD